MTIDPQRPVDHDGTIERTPEGGVIRFERHLPYGIDDVWGAITQPARLAEWWLPVDGEITVDLREGGLMTMTMPGDEPVTIVCEIRRLHAPTLLEHTHADPGSLMRWELESVVDGTRLRLSHHVQDVPAAIARCYVVGLHTSLGRLAPSLAGAPIAWDWDEFAALQARYAEVGLAPAATPPSG